MSAVASMSMLDCCDNSRSGGSIAVMVSVDVDSRYAVLVALVYELSCSISDTSFDLETVNVSLEYKVGVFGKLPPVRLFLLFLTKHEIM